MPTSSTLLLVPGAFHGAWLWDEVLPHLPASARALELPTVRAGVAPSSGMAEDAEAIRTAIDAIDGPVTLVAHSYGGIPATEALDEVSGVAAVIYVAAFLVPVGASLLDASGGERPAAWADTEDPALVAMDPDAARQGLYNGIDGELVERYVTRMQPQALAAFTEALSVGVPAEVPSTYVVCTDDLALPPEQAEQIAAQAQRVEHIATGHLPMLAAPEELARLLLAAAA